MFECALCQQDASCGWNTLESLVATAGALGKTVRADALAYVEKGYHRFKPYAPRILAALKITGAGVVEPLLAATGIVQNKQDIPRSALFLQPRSKWRGHLCNPETNRDKLWVVAVLFHLREAFRSGDAWLAHSRRYSDMKQTLVPIETAQTMGISITLEPEVWIEDRKRRLEDGLQRLAMAVRNGALPGGIIDDGRLRVERLEADVPAEADSLILDLYRRLPEVRITDILTDVDNNIGLTDAFTHLRTGAPCKDRLGLLNVILAEGLKLGLSKMAGASSTHSFAQLARLSNWHVEGEVINRALPMVIDAQARLPI